MGTERETIVDRLGIGNDIMDLVATKNWPVRKIAEHMQKEGYDVSQISIYRYIKRQQEQRAEVTKTLVQEHLKETVPRDLKVLDLMIRKSAKMFFKDQKLTNQERMVVMRELRQTIDTKLKYSGAGSPDTAPGVGESGESPRDRIASRIAELVARRTAKFIAEGDV